MEGLEITVISKQRLNFADRADAEYLSKENLLVTEQVQKRPHRKLGELCELVASAFYPPATQLYEAGNVPFVRCVDCIGNPVITNDHDKMFERVPDEFVLQNGSVRTAGLNDIVLTKVGTPCFASLIEDYDRVALSRTVLGITRIRNLNPYYLMTFLRSHHGFTQLQRQRELTIQYQLTLERVRDVEVYIPTMSFQQHIEALIRTSLASLRQSRGQEKAAVELLSSSLKLHAWTAPEALSYVCTLKEAMTKDRLDAQYFQPKYTAIAEQLKRNHVCRSLNELGSVGKGFSVDYSESGRVKVIRSGDLTSLDSDENFLTTDADDYYALEVGDVLISSIGFGSIGKVQVFDLPGRFATVSEVTVVRQRVLDPYYLAAFLRTPAGQMQLEQHVTGATGQLHLYPKDVATVLVPVVALDIQQQCRTLYTLGKQSRERAKELLERAKHAVYIAIEQSEEAALKFLRSQG